MIYRLLLYLPVIPPQETHNYHKNQAISNSYSMGCPPVRGDNPRALASGLSYVQVDKHGITILYHLHQCIPFAHFVLKLVREV